MCGITGFIEMTPRPTGEARDLVIRMTRALQHRGPDSEGYWQSPSEEVNFGHRRLAIIDLSPTGGQPMTTADNRYTLSYNGEIYNFIELRKTLEGDGVSFRGCSDTEVLLQALAIWGVEPTLRKLNGMFAFSFWDAAEQVLYLARDRFGEKPLYYAWHNHVFLFGSELKALAQHPAFERKMDADVLASYMRFSYVASPLCIFKGAHKLQAGHFLKVHLGKPPGRSQPYWQLCQVVRDREYVTLKPGEPGLIDLVERTLRRAVKIRMVADVPLGAFLSGGIDSSTIVALMQAESSRPIKTFTIGFWATGYNEGENAALVAKHLGTEHHEYYLSSRETMDAITRLPEIYDEPFADSSQIPTTLVSQFTRRHVTVALSGDGGDELFGGYNRYVWSRRLWPTLGLLPQRLRQYMREVMLSFSPESLESIISAANPFVSPRLRVRGGGEKMHKLATAVLSRNTDEFYRCLVSQWQEPLNAVYAETEAVGFSDDRAILPSNLEYPERMMYWDQMTYLSSDILCKVDRASMSESLEARVPFLDNDVVKLAWSLPLSVKINKGIAKWPLQQILKRYLPPKLFERPKAGFGVPIEAWLRGPLRSWAEGLLDERRLYDQHLFNPKVIRHYWQEHLSGRRNFQHLLWNVLMFEAWRDRWT